jgi:PAS domain S-box-containing protein
MGSKLSALAEKDALATSAEETFPHLKEEIARKAEQLRTAENAFAEQEIRLQLVISELRRSKAHLAEAQRLGRMGSVGIDVGTKRVFWSDEAARIYGYPSGTEPTPDLILQRSHPDDLSRLKTVLERAALGGCDFDWEHRLLMPDGSIKHLHDVGRRVTDAAGNEEIVGAIMDITQRELGAEALRASQHLARGQLDALVDTLAALAREPKPAKFLEHVYYIICKQLGAAGLVGWKTTNDSNGIELIGAYHDDRLHLPTPEEMQVLRAPGANETHPVWKELFSNPEACAYSRITLDPLAADIALLPAGDWYDSLHALAGNSVMEKRLERRAKAGIVGTLIVPTVVGGKVSGCYFISFKQHRQFRQEELGLTRAMVHLATLAHQLYGLMEQSREAAIVRERNRLARDIHDTLAQGFTGVIMQLEAAKDAMQRQDWSAVDEHVGRAGRQARASLGDARHSVVALRPHSVRHGQFSNALRELMRRLSDGSQVHATFQIEGEERPLEFDWEDNLLRIAQEAFNNTLKHAKAKVFQATLKFYRDRIEFHLVDDGSGFDISEPHDGFGLVGIRERANGMRGRFSLQSGPGKGTEITIVLDLSSS